MALAASPAAAQSSRNQFGGQDRADAASQAIVLAVQHGISMLPPTSGQAYTWKPSVYGGDWTYQTGPNSFRVPETVEQGATSVRLSASFFRATANLSPTPYRILEGVGGRNPGFTAFGLSIAANVGVLNLSATHGLAKNWEISLNLPLTLVDAAAEQAFPIERGDALAPSPTVSGAPTLAELEGDLASGALLVRKQALTLSGNSFNEGAKVGVGRISIGSKYTLVDTEAKKLSGSTAYQVGIVPELFFPSPSESQFAGSESFALALRLLGRAFITEELHAVADIGYEYDFRFEELRRVAWDAGVILSLDPTTVDLGFGGSVYAEGITWTPNVARTVPDPQYPSGLRLEALGNNRLSTNFVDFIAGAKVLLAPGVALGGTINVPIVGSALRPAIAATIDLEFYFQPDPSSPEQSVPAPAEQPPAVSG